MGGSLAVQKCISNGESTIVQWTCSLMNVRVPINVIDRVRDDTDLMKFFSPDPADVGDDEGKYELDTHATIDGGHFGCRIITAAAAAGN